MPRFRQTAEILKLMAHKESIRNIGIVAHIDHGKTTMTDSLLAEAGLLSPKIAGTARALDYLEEEQRRGITIKTANISLLHETLGRRYVINLIDTPGHVDFTGKVTRALRATDGAVVVVDAVEEIMAQTETVTRQALGERVKPVLFINKVDRLIEELRLDENQIQKKFVRIIRDFNNLIEIYGEPEFKDKWKVDPAKETVAFGSALHKWGLTVGVTRRKGTKFNDIVDAYGKGKRQTLAKLAPLHDAILDMTTKNIPSPADAQKYRIPKIWKGELNSEIGEAMLNCNDKGPTTVCVTNVQTDPISGTVITCRLFSGSIKEGDKVYVVGEGKELLVQQVAMYMSSYRESVKEITAGNITALLSVDSARVGETLVDSAYKDIMVPFELLQYVSEPVMMVALEPKHPENLPHLHEAMKRVSIEDPNLVIAVNEKTGEYLLSGIGELHLEIALKSLRDYAGGIEISASNPAADYRESVAGKGEVVMAKSLNKQNSFWMQVEPLKNRRIETVKIGHLETVWAVNKHHNILINSRKDIEHLEEVRDMIVSGFHWACETGPLCEQPMRNVIVKLQNAKVHEDPAQRGSTQVSRAVSRAVFGSFLTANPVLLEPIYKIVVSVPTDLMGICLKILTRRRGKISATEQKGTLMIITGHMPVAETFGLSAEMRSATSGRAYWQSTFDRWDRAPESIATRITKQIRVQRGLSPEIPGPNKFIEAV
jgi:elongation factor 2